MKIEIIKSLISNFESYANKSSEGIEFWLARDLQQLLGYTKWDNFTSVISKAKTACEITGHSVNDHFADVGKTIQMPKGAQKEVPDIMLTRYACYLIAQNGDPRKEEIAFAQNYFAVQTRKFEIIEKRIQEFERLTARQKLTETEKELSGVIFQQTGSDKNFALKALEQFDKRAHITAEGFVTPKEALNTDQWVPYNMKGIFTITKMLE